MRFLLWRRCTLVFLSIIALISTISVDLQGQEYDFFESENESPDAIFGWDVFSGGYPGPHVSTLDDEGAFLAVAPAGGLISSTSNLYAFFTIPTYTISLSDMDITNDFSTVVVQIATSEIIDATRFSLEPNEFFELGVRSTLLFGEDEIDINYYWAEWVGMEAAEAFEVSMAGMEMHVSFSAVRASYFNSVSPLNVSFGDKILYGDVNCDGAVDLLDVSPFVEHVSSGEFNIKADMNQDGSVDLLDVSPFVVALTGA